MAELDIDAALAALDEEDQKQNDIDVQSALDALDAADEGVDGTPMDPELKALLERNPQINITGEAIDDPRVPIGGRLTYDVTDQVRAAAAEEGPRDYEYFYGSGPETAPYLTRLGAFISDFSDAVTPGEQQPNELQTERDNAAELGEAFMRDMTALYENAPTAEEMGLDVPNFDGGGDVRVMPRLNYDEEGQLTTEYVRIPAPDSSAFERVIDQAGRNIFQQWGALVTEGSVSGNSELEQRVPDLESDGLESLMTTVITYGSPAAVLERAGRTLGRGTAALAALDRTSRGYKWAGITGASIGVAISDAVMSEEGQDGLIVRPEHVADVLKIENPETAADVAMFIDGMIINGAFDAGLGLLGAIGNLGRERVRGLRGFVDPTYVRDSAKRATLIDAIAVIDPELVGAEPRTLASNLRNMALVLDANSEAILRIGQTTGEVPLDTVNALANGAEQYIAASRANLRRTMTEPEWDEYVASEAQAMVERTIGLARSQEGNTTLRTAQAQMSSAVDNTIIAESDRLLPRDSNNLQEGAQALVDQRAGDVADATRSAENADRSIEAITATRNNAVANDPFIRELIASDDPLRFFNNSEQVEKLRTVLGEDLFNQYRQSWQGVQDAYRAIPNVEIDTESFIDQVNSVVRETNLLDSTGGQTKRILGRIYSSLQPQAIADEAGDMVFETAEELLARVDGQIGFQDLYRVRQQLSNMIDEASDPAIANRLKELKSHITDPKSGQLGFVIKNGDAAAADAAVAADRLYMDTMSRFQDSEPLRRFSDMAAVRNAGENTPTSERFLRRGEADISSGTVNEILPTVAGDVTGYQYSALRQAFDNPDLVQTLDTAVADLYIAEGTRELSRALRGASEQSPEMIISAFEEQARILRQTNNPIAGQLEEAAARIRQLQSDLGDDLLVAEEAARQARAAISTAEDTIVERFIRQRKPELATGSVQQRITTMLSEADAGDSFEDLMAEIRRLPDGQRQITEQAFQGAVLRSLREKVFGATPIATDAVDVRLGSLDAINRETSNNILGGVRAAFDGQPDVITGIEEALQALQSTNIPPRIRTARAGSDTAANMNIRGSVGSTILFTLGYMNPTAAAARNLTAQQVNSIEAAARDTGRETMATILAAPKEFAELLNAVARKEDPTKLQMLRGMFLTSAQEALRYELRVEPSELLNDTLIAIEEAITRTEADYPVPEGMDQ